MSRISLIPDHAVLFVHDQPTATGFCAEDDNSLTDVLESRFFNCSSLLVVSTCRGFLFEFFRETFADKRLASPSETCNAIFVIASDIRDDSKLQSGVKRQIESCSWRIHVFLESFHDDGILPVNPDDSVFIIRLAATPESEDARMDDVEMKAYIADLSDLEQSTQAASSCLLKGVEDAFGRFALLIKWGEVTAMQSAADQLSQSSCDDVIVKVERLIALAIVSCCHEALELLLTLHFFDQSRFITQEKVVGLYKAVITHHPQGSLATLVETEGKCAHISQLDFNTVVGIYYSVSDVNAVVVNNVRRGDVLSMDDLFYLTILMLELDLSIVIWRKCQFKLACAIRACQFLGTMSEYRFFAKNVSALDAIAGMREYYEDAAKDLSEMMYSRSFERTKQYLVSSNVYRVGSNILQVAGQGDCNKFFASTACLSLIDSVWTGQMKDHVYQRDVAAAILFPPALGSIPMDQFKSVRHLQPQQPQSLSRAVDRSDSVWHGIPTWKKIVNFYEAPITRFMLSFLSYIVFVLFFSNMMLLFLKHIFSTAERIVVFYMTAFALELLLEIRDSVLLSPFNAYLRYFSDYWHLMDINIVVSFFLGFALRLDAVHWNVLPVGFDVSMSEILYTYCLFCCYVRLLRFFSMTKALGAYIIMIQFMWEDLRAFILVLLVVVLGYGVGTRSLLVNHQKSVWAAFWGFLLQPFMQVYGFDLFLDNVAESFNCTLTTDDVTYVFGGCTKWDFRPHFTVLSVFIFYLVTGMIMLNLLIAIFSDTYARVRENTALFWNITFYRSVAEFCVKPVLPVPVTLISRSIAWIFCLFGLVTPRIPHLSKAMAAISPANSDKKSGKVENPAFEELTRWVHYQERAFMKQRFSVDKK